MKRWKPKLLLLVRKLNVWNVRRSIDLELSKATSSPITNTPSKHAEEKTGRASAEYKKAFWNAMRTRAGEGLDVT